ncbi:MAG: hypothetical protein LBE65_02415 [Synergistaceae bacterium]|nr:hypothetical protein [Synergistaceae bacterium]
MKKQLPPGTYSFEPRQDDDGYIKLYDETGKQIFFGEGAESALPGSSFSYTLDDGTKEEDVPFPQVLSLEEQLAAKCVPYMELNFAADGKTVKSVNIRFVDPDDPDKTPLLAGNDAPVGWVNDISIDTLDGDFANYPAEGLPRNSSASHLSDGTELKTYIDIKDIAVGNIKEVRLRFGYRGYQDKNGKCTAFEMWHFAVNDKTTGSGGCDAGFAGLGLILAVALLARKVRK